MIIKAPHPIIEQPNTYLTASAVAAATTLTVANNAGFVANDYIVAGRIEQEGAELHKISTVSGNNTINVAGDALKFDISVNTPISYIKYNQVRFYMGDWSARYYTGSISIDKDSAVVTGIGVSWGSITTAYALLLNGKWYDIKSIDSATQITLTENYTDESVVSSDYALVLFAVQSGSTVAIAVDQEYTLWDDTDSLTEDYYRSEYYNSTTTAASTKSSIISAAEQEGFSEYARISLEDQVLSDLRDKGAKRRSRDEIDRDINDAIKELVNAIVADVQEDYLSTYGKINFKATCAEYPLFDDFRKLTSIWISFNGSDYKKSTPMRISDDRPNINFTENDPRHYIRDNILGVRPVPAADVTVGAKVWYDRRIPSLQYDGDEIPFVLRDWKRAIIDFCLEKGLLADDQNKASVYGVSFKGAIKDMVNALKDRDTGQIKLIEAVNDLDLYD